MMGIGLIYINLIYIKVTYTKVIHTNVLRTKTKAVRSIYLALALASVASAQVGAPVLGYLPAGGRILPVHGISASASIAPALDFGGQFLRMAVSPQQDFVLVSTAASGAVLLAYPSGATTAVAGAAAYPSSITLSPSGSAAALWYASAHLLEIVSNLRSTPTVRTVDASFLGTSSDPPAAFAVSDDGAWAAGAWSAGVWAFGPNGEVRNVLTGDRASALAFFNGQQSLLAATRTGVSSIADVGGIAPASTLYTSEEGQAPVGLAVSADNRTAILAEQRGGIVAIDLSAGGLPVRLDCACAPEGVFPMGGSVFRITGLTGSVFRVFDARAGSVFQVPLATGVQAPPANEVLSGVVRSAGRAAESGLGNEGTR